MELYGLLGYPLGHSFSARYFADKFEQLGREAQYVNFEYPSVEEALTDLLQREELKGFNVTIPYKQQILPYLQAISPEAQQIGAVNVVKVLRDASGQPQWVGYNSDVLGFVQSFRNLCPLSLADSQALVLGTGGASKAVVYGLQSLGFTTQSVSRRPQEGVWTYEQLTPEVLAAYKIIVNCTPLGMYPQVDACPDLPYEALTESHYLFDLVYNPEVTLFLKQGLQRGAKVKNGLEMLHLQAEAAWNIWTASDCE